VQVSQTAPPNKSNEHQEDKQRVDLSFLLNLLDGVLENPGRIVIMTSNFPDTLDSALIRPGRIDVIAKFRNCTNKTVIEMIEFFYDITLSDEDKSRIWSLQEEIVTPAEMSKIMFENFSNMEASIAHMEKLSTSFVKERLIEQEQTITEIFTPGNENQEDMSCSNIQGELRLTEGELRLTEGELRLSEASSEEKGDTYKACTDEMLHITKIRIDTVYVFKTLVLPCYTSKYKINAMPSSYYVDILKRFVFSEKLYVASCNMWKQDFANYFNKDENLEELSLCNNIYKNRSAIKYNRSAIKYKDLLHCYFSPDLMCSTGLNKQLYKDGVLETPIVDFKSNLGTGIDNYSGSLLTSSQLNSATFSAF